MLHFDGAHPSPSASARSCGRVLARLTRLRVLTRLPREVGGVHGGSSVGIYAVGPIGWRLLERSLHQGWWEPSTTFLDHSLAVADVFVTIVAASKRDELQLINYEPEPACWRAIPGRREQLRPDLLVVIGQQDLEYHWWLEIDRGNEHRRTIARHCQAYLDLLHAGSEQTERGVFPRVAWLTTTPQRLANLRSVAAEVQGDLPLFEVGLLDDPLAILLPAGGSP